MTYSEKVKRKRIKTPDGRFEKDRMIQNITINNSDDKKHCEITIK
jgi:hypothetical protein